MKKFFLVLVLLGALCINSFIASTFFHGPWSWIVNGILFGIVINIFISRWKKVGEEITYKKLSRLSLIITTTTAAEREALIAKTDFSWRDVHTVRVKIEERNLNKGDIQLILLGKKIQSLIDLIEVSTIKKQIIWKQELVDAIKDLEYFAKLTFNDHLLKMLAGEKDKLVGAVRHVSDYTGAETLLGIIHTEAPSLEFNY